MGVFSMSRPPYLYGCENIYNSTRSPSAVHCSDNNLFYYFFNMLLDEAISVYKWNIPVEWDMRFFLYNLYLKGYIGIYKDPLYGVIPSQISLRGVGIFYQPTEATTINPLSQQQTLTIDKDIVVFKIREDYRAPIDLIAYYADLMALTAQSLGVNILNSKVTNIFSATKKSTAESLKKAFDEVASGKPAVIVDKSLVDEGSLEKYSIATELKAQDLHNELQRIHNEYLTQIGVNNVDSVKKERLIVDEANANNDVTELKASLWLDCLKKGCQKAKELFDVDISVDWRFKPDENSIDD